ncbi:hypothetical protein BCR44DRAFT_285700 [Catenaria anguillulae PL171]|uniref:Uncharacterized protein n=1 Tax=Catenaria anguillulae PL171 TaxID=765915 RepID=A0A1Y2HRN4_9FUNG|nr:hypothetical protein BCR44DRAFT_285700 [Catenaria anguillulae PL171]
MVTFVATSSVAIYVGPLLMRIHASHKLNRSQSESMVDSNESLSTNRVSPTVAAGSSGNAATVPLAIPTASALAGGQSANRSAATTGVGAESTGLPVPTTTTPMLPTGGAGVPVKSSSALSSIMASSTNSLDAVPFPISPLAASPVSEHPPTLSFTAGNSDDMPPTVPNEITQLFLRVFQCHARHHLPDFVANQPSVKSNIRDRMQLQWNKNKGGKDGVVKEWHKWTRVELWCLYSGEPGVGCVMIQADGIKIVRWPWCYPNPMLTIILL